MSFFFVTHVLSCVANSYPYSTALLSQTLRTYQRAACDTDQVALSCPRGTSISIEFAQYNKFNERGGKFYTYYIFHKPNNQSTFSFSLHNLDGVTIEDLCPLNGGNSERSIEARMKTNRQLLSGSTFGLSGGILKQMQSANFPNGSHIYYDTTNTSSGGPSGKDNLPNELNVPENCLWPNALQVNAFVHATNCYLLFLLFLFFAFCFN